MRQQALCPGGSRPSLLLVGYVGGPLCRRGGGGTQLAVGAGCCSVATGLSQARLRCCCCSQHERGVMYWCIHWRQGLPSVAPSLHNHTGVVVGNFIGFEFKSIAIMMTHHHDGLIRPAARVQARVQAIRTGCRAGLVVSGLRQGICSRAQHSHAVGPPTAVVVASCGMYARTHADARMRAHAHTHVRTCVLELIAAYSIWKEQSVQSVARITYVHVHTRAITEKCLDT